MLRSFVCGIVTITVVAILLLAKSATAQDISGVYVDLGAGINIVPEQDGRISAVSIGHQTDFDGGLALKAAIGATVLPNIRVELEVAHRLNDAGDNLDFGQAGSIPSKGDVDVTTVMANLFYVHQLGASTNLLVGGGLGWAHLDVDIKSTFGPAISLLGGTDNRFAYQARAGIETKASSSMSLYAEYNYLGTTGSDYDGLLGNLSTEQALDYDSHSIMAGVRFQLGD